MIRRILGAFGLAPAAQIARQGEEHRRALDRITALEERLDALRSEAQSWKQRHEATAGELASRQEAAAASAAAAREQAQNEITRWKDRAERVTAQADELRARLADAERATLAAREHLMATEMKLDLLEAAIQVLDSRSREQAVE